MGQANRLSALLFRSVLAALLVVAAQTAPAQPLPGDVQLGMSLPQLQGAVPQLRPLPPGTRLARGLASGWSAPALVVAGVALTPTYFFADGQLRRVDYGASPADSTDAGFDALRAWGRSAWGPELASTGPEGSYASWSADDVEAYVQQARTPEPALRLVVKRRVVKDGSEL